MRSGTAAAWAGPLILAAAAGLAWLTTRAGLALPWGPVLGLALLPLLYDAALRRCYRRLRDEASPAARRDDDGPLPWQRRIQHAERRLRQLTERLSDPSVRALLVEARGLALQLAGQAEQAAVLAERSAPVSAGALHGRRDALAQRAASLPPGPYRAALRAHLRALDARTEWHARHGAGAEPLTRALESATQRLERTAEAAARLHQRGGSGEAAAVRAALDALRAGAAALTETLGAWRRLDPGADPLYPSFPRTRALLRCLAALVLVAVASLAAPADRRLFACLAGLGCAVLLVSLWRGARPALPGRQRRLALTAVAASSVSLIAAGPLAYQHTLGEATEATVTASGGPYHLRQTGTGRDLGRMDLGPHQRAAAGQRLTVRTDPLGLVPPVAEERLGSVGAVLPAAVTGVSLAGLLGGTAVAAARERARRHAPAAGG